MNKLSNRSYAIFLEMEIEIGDSKSPWLAYSCIVFHAIHFADLVIVLFMKDVRL